MNDTHSKASDIPCGLAESVWQDALQNPSRIIQLEHQGKKLWLKKCSPARGWFGYWALRRLCSLLDAPLFAAVPQLGGREALATEGERLRQLKNAGVRVPEILWQDQDNLLITDIGHNLNTYLKGNRNTPENNIAVIKLVFEKLNQVHLQGQYLSQNFSRNIMLDINGDDMDIGFIDFEDDPCEAMSLENAQARDLILLLYAVGRYFESCREEYTVLAAAELERLPEAVKQQLRNVVRKLSWLTRLPRQKSYSRDYSRFVDVMALLSIV